MIHTLLGVDLLSPFLTIVALSRFQIILAHLDVFMGPLLSCWNTQITPGLNLPSDGVCSRVFENFFLVPVIWRKLIWHLDQDLEHIDVGIFI